MPGSEKSFAVRMSFAQERLWFLDRLDSGHPTYNIPMAMGLQGRVDTADVVAALNDLSMRHEILRTTFRVIGDEPMQVISPKPNVGFETLDLSGLPPSERQAAAFQRAQEAARVPFDLARGPLIRAVLVRVSDGDHVLILTVHHIIADLWSSGVFSRDLSAFLEARRHGTPVNLPELPVQYADFAEWQRTVVTGPSLRRLTDYWTAQLADAPVEVTFPPDHPRPPSQSFRGETLLFHVPLEISRALAQISREEGATLFMTLVAAFKFLLGRCAGTEDVSVGTPIANRTRREIENLIGFFSNTLVLRTQLHGDPTFRELVRRVRAVTLGAYDHQDLPFEQLVAILGTERNVSHSPLFQVLFGLQTIGHQTEPASSSNGPSGSFEWGAISTNTAKFDATVLVNETDLGLEAGFEYCTDLYERQTIRNVVEQYVACLRAVAENPDARLTEIARVAFAAGHERARTLSFGKRVDVEDSSPVDQFEAQVSRTPQAVAIVAGDPSHAGRATRSALSFEELDGRANQVAWLLRSRGVQRGDAVGICMGSVVEMPAALLGVLKCGAAYVPLDPAYPAERLAYMGRKAGVRLVLSTRETAGVLPADVATRLDLDAEARAELDDQPRRRLGDRLHRDDVAYVIFTSGSTGRPKGIALPHGVLANLVAWQVANSEPNLKTCQLAPLSFDVSFQEMFSTWCGGGTIVLCGEHLRKNGRALLALARRHWVERIFLPPAMLQLLADVADPEDWPRSVREIVTAGEMLRITPAIRRVLLALDSVVLRNQYGPSETHVVTEYRTSGTDPELGELPPIGTPIQNARTYILDEGMDPVPLGARGELYLGGPVLARGYADHPELTAERFLPDPFAEEGGARLYRTGDLARFRPDGHIQFLGRADDQLKIRGYRVEPGEIETELERIDGVRAAAVVGHAPAGPRPLFLVAYVVSGAGSPRSGQDLRQLLRARLPQWMVPDRIAFVDELPLTPSGKIDRRALSRRELALEEVSAESIPPQGQLEATLCELWSEVLGIPVVGVQDSFFDLGGHSLAVARVAARVRERMGVELPLRVFFEATDIDALAREIVLHRIMATDPDEIEALLSDAEGRQQTSPPARSSSTAPSAALSKE